MRAEHFGSHRASKALTNTAPVREATAMVRASRAVRTVWVIVVLPRYPQRRQGSISSRVVGWLDAIYAVECDPLRPAR